MHSLPSNAFHVTAAASILLLNKIIFIKMLKMSVKPRDSLFVFFHGRKKLPFICRHKKDLSKHRSRYNKTSDCKLHFVIFFIYFIFVNENLTLIKMFKNFSVNITVNHINTASFFIYVYMKLQKVWHSIFLLLSFLFSWHFLNFAELHGNTDRRQNDLWKQFIFLFRTE